MVRTQCANHVITLEQTRAHPIIASQTHRTRIIFTAGAGLRMFVANPFNIWIALSKARMLTKRLLANLLSISK